MALSSEAVFLNFEGVQKSIRKETIPEAHVAPSYIYEPKCGGMEGELRGLVSANELICAHVAHLNFRDLTPYLTNGYSAVRVYLPPIFWRQLNVRLPFYIYSLSTSAR
jgi:hypothetical protein